MGGVTIGGVGDAIPELIDRLVYISAGGCAEVLSIVDDSQTSANQASLLFSLADAAVGDPAQIGAGRANYRSADRTFLAAAKAALMAEATDQQFMAFLATLQPDESLALMLTDARVQAQTRGTIRRSYIRLREDSAIPLATQDRMIAEADALSPHNRFEVQTLATSHVGFLLRAREVASMLAGLASADQEP
ncbi:MAG: hypothetical protein RL385_6135 [Pseudomonadota bacterium]|jgi:hypothetical protein